LTRAPRQKHYLFDHLVIVRAIALETGLTKPASWQFQSAAGDIRCELAPDELHERHPVPSMRAQQFVCCIERMRPSSAATKSAIDPLPCRVWETTALTVESAFLTR